MPSEHYVPVHFIEKLLRLVNSAQAHARQSQKDSDAIFVPGNMISGLSGQEAIRYLCRIAEDPGIPPAVLVRLASHSSSEVREAVSDNPALPFEALKWLVHDECVDVRYAIAENHNTPASILNELAEDENPYVSHRATQTLSRLQKTSPFASKKTLSIERTIGIHHSRLQYST